MPLVGNRNASLPCRCGEADSPNINVPNAIRVKETATLERFPIMMCMSSVHVTEHEETAHTSLVTIVFFWR